MVRCENMQCVFGWFHPECVDFYIGSYDEILWYCVACRFHGLEGEDALVRKMKTAMAKRSSLIDQQESVSLHDKSPSALHY